MAEAWTSNCTEVLYKWKHLGKREEHRHESRRQGQWQRCQPRELLEYRWLL